MGLPPRLPPLRGKLSAARLTDEGAYRISVFFFMDSPSSASHSLGTFPLGGGRLCGRLIAAPTVHRKPVGAHSMRPKEFAPGALVRKRQARERNRTSPNFPPTQAPSGAGRDRTQSLLILRAGNVLPTSRGNPRKWGPGKGDYEHKVLIWSRPRGRFGYFAAMGKVTRRPQAAKPPLRTTNPIRNLPPHPPPSGAPSPQGEGL